MTLVDLLGMIITLLIWAAISFTVLAIIPIDDDDNDKKGENT